MVKRSGEEFDQALTFARSALNLLTDSRIAPTPARFQVVYSHQMGVLPDLSLSLNRLLSHDRLSGQTVDELYDQFFAPETEAPEIRQAGERIEKSIDDVAEAVGAAHGATTQFSGALTDFAAEVQAALPPGLEEAVLSVLDATRQMVDTNRALEERLRFTLREVELMRDHLDRLERESVLDALTGIGNRKRFDKSLREAVARANSDVEPVTLLMIDIDHFKKFNDTHGHQMGDQVLKLVSRQLLGSTRDQDVAARYGGEEFGVIMPRTTLSAGIKIGDDIRRAVCEKSVVNRRTGRTLGHVTLSIGVAQYRIGESAAELVHRADEALYLAKGMGRNRIVSERSLPSAAA
jgi:diguanylate cyclase